MVQKRGAILTEASCVAPIKIVFLQWVLLISRSDVRNIVNNRAGQRQTHYKLRSFHVAAFNGYAPTMQFNGGTYKSQTKADPFFRLQFRCL